MKIGYWAKFNYDEYQEIENGIAIDFPDIEGAYTCAKNEEEGKRFAKEVLELATYNLLVKDLPKCSEYEDINIEDNEKLFWIEYETSDVNVIEFD